MRDSRAKHYCVSTTMVRHSASGEREKHDQVNKVEEARLANVADVPSAGVYASNGAIFSHRVAHVAIALEIAGNLLHEKEEGIKRVVRHQELRIVSWVFVICTERTSVGEY